MKRQAGVLIVVALALVALGQLAGRDGAWAAPGQSPERQSYPSMTPSRRPGEPTNTRASGPTQPPGPPSGTPGPTVPTDTPVAHTFTPTPAEPTPLPPVETPSPTVDQGQAVEPVPTLAPTASSTVPPAEVETATAPPLEGSGTDLPAPSDTEPSGIEVPAEATETPRPVQVSATLPADAGAPLDEGVLAALGRDWMLICGLGLLILALLVFILGYTLGRQRGKA